MARAKACTAAQAEADFRAGVAARLVERRAIRTLAAVAAWYAAELAADRTAAERAEAADYAYRARRSAAAAVYAARSVREAACARAGTGVAKAKRLVARRPRG